MLFCFCYSKCFFPTKLSFCVVSIDMNWLFDHFQLLFGKILCVSVRNKWYRSLFSESRKASVYREVQIDTDAGVTVDSMFCALGAADRREYVRFKKLEKWKSTLLVVLQINCVCCPVRMDGTHAQALVHISRVNGLESIIRLFGRRSWLFTICFQSEYETHTQVSDICAFLFFGVHRAPFHC